MLTSCLKVRSFGRAGSQEFVIGLVSERGSRAFSAITTCRLSGCNEYLVSSMLREDLYG